MIRRWILGSLAGTLLIAITSPWFVRSYLPRESNRGVRTLPAGHAYRWRSEGYATTHVGRWGMPGRTSWHSDSETSPSTFRIALWGDSQAEGVCVEDHEKLFAQIELHAKTDYLKEWSVYPLAQSGDNLQSWLRQLRWAEQELNVDRHLIFFAEVSDLLVNSADPRLDGSENSSNDRISAIAPAFVIQSARNLLCQPDGQSRRKLRFTVGPHRSPKRSAKVSTSPLPIHEESLGNQYELWRASIDAIVRQTTRPVVLVYAPRAPQIIGGKVHWDNPEEPSIQLIASIAQAADVQLIDTTNTLIQAAKQGRWPHGFHNGQFGQGHLNSTGNRYIAKQVVMEILNHPAPPATLMADNRGNKR